MGSRHEAREWALQFLFQSEFNRDESLDEGFRLFWEHLNETADAPAGGTDSKEHRLRAKSRQFAEELARGEHYAQSAEYRAYREGITRERDLWCNWSEKYVNWRQLEVLGLMSKGNWA